MITVKIVFFAFAVLLFSSGMIIPSFAHTTVEVDPYEIEAGWAIEPPIVGIRNDIVFKIIERGENEGAYTGITSAFKNVDATITLPDKKFAYAFYATTADHACGAFVNIGSAAGVHVGAPKGAPTTRITWLS